jgi:hypothetical protein
VNAADDLMGKQGLRSGADRVGGQPDNLSHLLVSHPAVCLKQTEDSRVCPVHTAISSGIGFAGHIAAELCPRGSNDDR